MIWFRSHAASASTQAATIVPQSSDASLIQAFVQPGAQS